MDTHRVFSRSTVSSAGMWASARWLGWVTGLSYRHHREGAPPCANVPWPGPKFQALPRNRGHMGSAHSCLYVASPEWPQTSSTRLMSESQAPPQTYLTPICISQGPQHVFRYIHIWEAWLSDTCFQSWLHIGVTWEIKNKTKHPQPNRIWAGPSPTWCSLVVGDSNV